MLYGGLGGKDGSEKKNRYRIRACRRRTRARRDQRTCRGKREIRDSHVGGFEVLARDGGRRDGAAAPVIFEMLILTIPIRAKNRLHN